MFRYLILGGAAALLSLALTPVVRALALWLGVYDEPGGRRIHRGRVPRLGGLAVLLALFGALALGPLVGINVMTLLTDYGWRVGWLTAGVLVVVAVGAFDDVWRLGPLPKLTIQILAGVLALAGGYGFNAVTNPFTGGVIELGHLGALVTLFWIVLVTNAFNLIDGLDGLAAGVAMIASTTLFVVSLVENRPDAALVSITFAGALAGFLYYNFSPASIFLGDSGSLLLGYVMAVLSIQSLQKGPTAVVILVPILALGLPLIDTTFAMARRFFESGLWTIFRADREHIHHRLVRTGMTHRGAVLVLYGVCVVLGLFAFLAVALRGAIDSVIVGVVAVALYFGIRRLGYPIRSNEVSTPSPSSDEEKADS